MYYTRTRLENKVNRAISEFLKKDIYLLEKDLHERSITHRLAIYLERQFSRNWQVDCEYNRNLTATKVIQLPKHPKDKSVFPDIIVHQRGSFMNLLAIEVKKNKPDSFDLEKLLQYRDHPELQYEHVLFIRFKTGRDIRKYTQEQIFHLDWDVGQSSSNEIA